MSVTELDPIDKTKKEAAPEKSWNVILQNPMKGHERCVVCILTLAFSMSVRKASEHAQEAEKSGRSVIVSDLPNQNTAEGYVSDANSHFDRVCSPPMGIGFKAEPNM